MNEISNFGDRGIAGLEASDTARTKKMIAPGGVVMRKLKPSDIPAAVELSAEAGWNQTAEDWCTLIDLSVDGCLGIEVDGELVSTTAHRRNCDDFRFCKPVPRMHSWYPRDFAATGATCGPLVLDLQEDLSPAQLEEIDRVCGCYPDPQDVAFMKEHLDEWLR